MNRHRVLFGLIAACFIVIIIPGYNQPCPAGTHFLYTDGWETRNLVTVCGDGNGP